jgi:hypothetical protein
MRSLNVSLFVAITIFLFSAVAAVSASAATLKWLVDGVPIVTPEAGVATGEITLTNLKTAIGTKVSVLCSGRSIGTVGPGSEGIITELQDLTGKTVTLTNRITCTNIEGCPKPELSPENLPWLTGLELMGTEAEPLFLGTLRSGGKGEPGYTMHCEVIGFPFEETCLGIASAKLVNDVAEGDVLAVAEAGEETGICGSETTATAEVTTGVGDEEGLGVLNSGLTLSVSYE